MSRLPITGSDDNTWGDYQNYYLAVSHNSDGTQKPVSAVEIKDQSTGTVVSSIINNATSPRTYTFPDRDFRVNTPNWYNVKDYGALGDNSTDDSAAISAAIAACPDGGTVYFPSGPNNIYICNSQITITKSINLLGEGTNLYGAATTIKGTSTNTLIRYSGTSAVAPLSGFIIKNLRFIDASASVAPVILSYCSNFNVDNVTLSSVYRGFQFLNCWHHTVDKYIIYNYTGNSMGISLANSDAALIDVGDYTISNSFFSTDTNSSAHIYQSGGGGAKIINCKFNGGVGKANYGYYYDTNTGNTVDIQISNCSFENFAISGIKIPSGSFSMANVTIMGNEFGYGGTAKYIDIDNVDVISIVGNVFTASVNNRGIAIANSDRINIWGNTFSADRNVVLTSCNYVNGYFDGRWYESANIDASGIVTGSNAVGVISGSNTNDAFHFENYQMPTAMAATTASKRLTATGAGSSSFNSHAYLITYAAGYTGSSATVGLTGTNASAGTNTTAPTTGTLTGNNGLAGISNATTTGYNYGVQGYASGGNISAGVIGLAQTAKNSATNYGAIGLALNTGTTPQHIGVYAGLLAGGTAVPTDRSAAIIANNGSTTSDIVRFEDNGVAVFRVVDGGRVVIVNSVTPSSASDTGVQGTIAWDSGFIYICTATNTWKRVAIATW